MMYLLLIIFAIGFLIIFGGIWATFANSEMNVGGKPDDEPWIR